MHPLRILVARIHALWRRDAMADEIREEMESHLQMKADELVDRGLGPEEARRVARQTFGNLTVLRDQGYDVRGAGLLETVAQDIRYGIRSLRKAPAFPLVALSVLGLSIGAGTTVYSVVDAAALRPLPFNESSRLVAVLGVDAPKATFSARGWTTTATYLDWRRMQRSFEAIAMVGRTSYRLK